MIWSSGIEPSRFSSPVSCKVTRRFSLLTRHCRILLMTRKLNPTSIWVQLLLRTAHSAPREPCVHLLELLHLLPVHQLLTNCLVLHRELSAVLRGVQLISCATLRDVMLRR